MVTVRPATAGDAAAVAAVYAPYVTDTVASFEEVPPDAAEVGRRMRAAPGLPWLVAVTLPNDTSVGLHEALGFTPVGVFRDVGFKHGAWHDVGWWQRPLRPLPDVPAAPRAWP